MQEPVNVINIRGKNISSLSSPILVKVSEMVGHRGQRILITQKVDICGYNSAAFSGRAGLPLIVEGSISTTNFTLA
jgi:hypothetical protein